MSGFLVSVAAVGETALGAITSFVPDLVIMDVARPGQPPPARLRARLAPRLGGG